MATAPTFGAAEPLSCTEKSIVASTVRTPEDVQAFVQFAYELFQEVGFEETYRMNRRFGLPSAIISDE